MGIRYRVYRYTCSCKPSINNEWCGGYHLASYAIGAEPPTRPCPDCLEESRLYTKAPLPRNTGGRIYPYYSHALGKTLPSAYDHKRELANPKDFRGLPLKLPDGTPLRYFEDGG